MTSLLSHKQELSASIHIANRNAYIIGTHAANVVVCVCSPSQVLLLSQWLLAAVLLQSTGEILV